MAGFQWDQGQPGGLGLGDLQRARQAGYSDSEILQGWRQTGIPIGDDANAELRRSQRASLFAPPPVQAPAPAPPPPADDGASTQQLLAYQQQLDQYRNESSANAFKLADYESQLNRYKSDLDTAKNQYKDVLGKYNESSTRIGTLGQELEKVKADSELYRSQLDNYKKDTVTQQLDVLRRGSGVNQGPSRGGADLTSGGGPVTRSTPRSGVDVVAKVDATDSVLDRRGPTVEVMSPGGGGANRVQARQRAMAAGSSGGSAAGYYASRFG